jgi:iron-sulfur cluster insertion protein
MPNQKEEINQINFSESAIERIKEIKKNPKNSNKFLRLSVSSGGCAGFQYIIELDDKIAESDIKINLNDTEIFAITDEISLPFLSGAEIVFIEELGSSYFKINNPNAKTNCGCGSSFST